MDVYVCMYVCMYLRTHVCMYVCMYVHVCMYVCMFACIHTYIIHTNIQFLPIHASIHPASQPSSYSAIQPCNYFLTAQPFNHPAMQADRQTGKKVI